MKKILFYIFCLGFLVVSCSKDNVVYEIPDWTTLSDTAKLGGASLFSLQVTTELAGYPQFNQYLKYSIEVYKISYKTVFKGDTITASGVVSFPVDATEALPIMLVGNGLAFADYEAPSFFDYPNQFTGFEFIAALGYITFLPDLIGYGDSKDSPNIFYNKEYTISAVVDFVKAANEFIESKGVESSHKHFLTGYSQGGYVALTAMKAIEEGAIDFPFEAAAIGAGGFDLHEIMLHNINEGVYPAPAHAALMLNSYNEIFEWNRPMSDFFKEPYLSDIPEVLSGKYIRAEADEFLTTDLNALLNPVFVQNYLNGNETNLITALQQNSIETWASSTPIKFFHSVNDEIFPLDDTYDTYISMNNSGSTQTEFVQLSGETHYESAFDFVEIVINWFDEFQ